MCRLPPMSARPVCGIVDAGAYKLRVFVLLPTTMAHGNTLSTPQKRIFLISGDHMAS